jgi:ubiquinol-cytochrome c reductase iron-sulfur subunit
MATTVDETVNRRDVIHIIAAGVVGIGAAAALWPLVDQMNPDASTLSFASTEVDLAPIKPGQAITVMWRGKPVFVRNRTPEEVKAAQDVKLDDLPDPIARVLGPDWATAPGTDTGRTKKGHENWLIAVGVCTHLGCIPKGQKPGEPKGEFGGWFCTCHGSQYDTAARIRKGPAPRNLDIPPYEFIADTKIKIG